MVLFLQEGSNTFCPSTMTRQKWALNGEADGFNLAKGFAGTKLLRQRCGFA